MLIRLPSGLLGRSTIPLSKSPDFLESRFFFSVIQDKWCLCFPSARLLASYLLWNYNYEWFMFQSEMFSSCLDLPLSCIISFFLPTHLFPYIHESAATCSTLNIKTCFDVISLLNSHCILLLCLTEKLLGRCAALSQFIFSLLHHCWPINNNVLCQGD